MSFYDTPAYAVIKKNMRESLASALVHRSPQKGFHHISALGATMATVASLAIDLNEFDNSRQTVNIMQDFGLEHDEAVGAVEACNEQLL